MGLGFKMSNLPHSFNSLATTELIVQEFFLKS